MDLSDRTGHLSRPKAAGTDMDVLRRTVYDRLDALDIGFEGSVGTPVRMGYLNTERNIFSAVITFCHNLYLLLYRINGCITVRSIRKAILRDLKSRLIL